MSHYQTRFSHAVDEADALTSATGEIIQWGAAAERVLGFTPAQAVGEALFDLISPVEMKSGLRRLLVQVGEDNNAQSLETVACRRDGCWCWLEVECQLCAAPLAIDNAEMGWRFRDVTALRVLRESKGIRDRYRELLGALPNPVLVANATCHVLHANRAAETLLGQAKGGLSDLCLWDIFKTDADLRAISLSLAGTEVADPQAMTQQLTAQALPMDGRLLSVGLVLRVLESTEGRFWIITVLPKQLPAPPSSATMAPPSQSLSEVIREALLAQPSPPSLLECSSLQPIRERPLVLIVDDEPAIRELLSQHLGSHFSLLTATDGEEGLETALRELPDLVMTDMLMPMKTGLELCHDLRAHPLTKDTPILMLTAIADQDNKLDSLAAGVSDFVMKPCSAAELVLRVRNLTQMNRQQQQLIAQNTRLEHTLHELQHKETQLLQQEKLASLGRMSAGLIHEINNPLNYAMQGIHLLKQTARALPATISSKHIETLDDVEEGITRVARIVADLRGFTHTTHEPVMELASVVTVVTEALRFFAHEWNSDCEVRLDIAEELRVQTDVGQLIQVISNLVKNALDACRSDPRTMAQGILIRLSAVQVTDRMRLSVRDNGPGMTEEVRARIFDPFFTTKEVGSGMGMGLSLCHSLIKDQGGRLEVITAPSAGAEFIIDLPAAP